MKKMLPPPMLIIAAVLAVAGCTTTRQVSQPNTVLCPVATSFETQTMAVAPKCVATTVGLTIQGDRPGSGSGVLISADGLILTVGHVVDKHGTPLTIRFADGRVVQGISLGVDRAVDTGMARITDPAPPGGWSFSPMAPADSAKPGEWVLALGNPGSIVVGRNPPLRLGRVMDHDQNTINSNCAIEPGDSGGPLFDLSGRVVGLGSSILLGDSKHPFNEYITTHIPISLYATQWNDLLAGKDTNMDKAQNDDDKKDEQAAATQPSDAPDESDNLDHLPRAAMELSKTSLGTLSLFTPALDAGGHCVVEIYCHDKPILLGTIVDPDGWIVTKASDLLAHPTVILNNGAAQEAKVVGLDTATDLALLKIDAQGLPAAKFTNNAQLGAWLVSPMSDPNQPAVSVVSVAARPIPETFTHFNGTAKVKLGLQLKDEGCVVDEVMPGMPAEAAGIKVGDQMLEINGTPLAKATEFVRRVMAGKMGETLIFKLRRAGKDMDIKAVLGEIKSVSDTDNSIGEEDEVANGKLS